MKKILLTGGTGGIGKSLARDFNANGYYVIVTGRNKDRFNEIDFKNPDKKASETKLESESTETEVKKASEEKK